MPDAAVPASPLEPQLCTRDHACHIDGPCNGLPRISASAAARIIKLAQTSEPSESSEEPSDLEVWLRANAGKTVTAADVLDQARIEAGLDPEDLDLFPALDRWDAPNGTRWQVNHEPPGGQMPDYLVLAMFVGDQADRTNDHVPGEGRIYVLPKTVDGKCRRYTFSRVAGSGGHRAEMKLALFVEELAHELNRMAVVFEVIEDDDEPDDPDDEEPEELEGSEEPEKTGSPAAV